VAPKRTSTPLSPIKRLLALTLALSPVLLAAGAWLTLPDPTELVAAEPKTTALIEQRQAEAKAKGQTLRIQRSPRPMKDLSPTLVRAIVLSEDGRFWSHDGFDWAELKSAAERDLETKSFARGGSTIPQQLAKNLYLGTKKSITRKLKEAILTVKLENALEKARILELYLNAVELGPGVFGVEAGAQHHFKQSAARLSPHQAALLAAMLPAPRKADVLHPSPKLAIRARRVLRLLRDAKEISPSEYERESMALEILLSAVSATREAGAP